MTFYKLNLSRFIGLDPVANILYPALLAVWVLASAFMAGFVLLMAEPLWFSIMIVLMLLVPCSIFTSGYRHYLRAEFEKPDDAISAPGIFGLCFSYLPFVAFMVEPVMPMWVLVPTVVFGILNCWLAWRMIDLSVDLRHGSVKA